MRNTKLALLALAAGIGMASCQKEVLNTNPNQDQLEQKADLNPNLKTTVGTNVQEFSEQVDASKERDRLGFRYWLWTDFEPTGFYVAPNSTLNVTVTQLQGNSLPKLILGTYYLDDNAYNYTPQTVQLQAGANNITVGDRGGLVWVRYATTGTPGSKAKITFNSGHQRAPIFIKNVTSQANWNSQLTTYTTPHVLLLGDRVMQVYSRTYAQSLQPQDNSKILDAADKGWDWENELAGYDGSSAVNLLPIYNKLLMVTTSDESVGAYAYYYGTAYASSAKPGAFTPSIFVNGWGTWHEMGHLHQQNIWTWSTLGEVTNNIFALYVERKMGYPNSRLKLENRYTPAFNFINNTDPNKDFNTMTRTYNDHFTRLVLFQQLYLAFGDQIFIQLNKRARLEPRNTSMTDEEKMTWFMKTACQITGRNLTTFFRKWGFKVNESVYTTIAGFGYPNPTIEPSTLTEDNLVGTIVNGGIYKITTALNVSSTMDCNSSTPVNGTAVTLWSSNNGNNQKWLARRSADGSFSLKSMADTTKVLDVPNGSTTAGTAVKMYVYNNTNAQKWKIESQGGGIFTLAPVHAPGLRLDVANSATSNGTTLLTWTATGNNNQKFKFEKLN